MALKSSDEFASVGRPNFDGSISWSWDDVFLVEVDNVDGRSVSNKYFLELDFWRHILVLKKGAC